MERLFSQKSTKLSYNDIEEASKVVSKWINPTQLTFSLPFTRTFKRNIYCKWENKLDTGSFKERGASFFITKLSQKEKEKGICAASAGNHALAVSKYAQAFGVKCTIVMPHTAPLVKVESVKNNGAEVELFGLTFDDAYARALKICREKKYTFVPAFDHLAIIAGQGSLGIELLSQLPEVDSIAVPIGGGGLISGICIAVKEKKPEVKIVGVKSEWSLKKDSSEDSPFKHISIADGIAVKREGKFTKPIIDKYVDEIVTASEEEIAQAIIDFLKFERAVVEGAGAAALCALSKSLVLKKCKNTVLIVSGSNIDINRLSRLIQRQMKNEDKLLRIVVPVVDRPGSLAAVTKVLSEIGANVLETFHDRSFSSIPGYVDITFLLEVRNK
ncbi:MAG: pyridoxal-phosphate dependent enzyme, partial [Candidatus Dadabacteria bacterium]